MTRLEKKMRAIGAGRALGRTMEEEAPISAAEVRRIMRPFETGERNILDCLEEAPSTKVVNAAPERSYSVGPVPMPADRIMLATANAVHRHCAPMMGDADREIFRVLCLDARSRLVSDVVASVGGADHCYVDPREVFRPAVLARCSGIILVHNHPSGDPEPSAQDFDLTRQMRQGGELLGIRVVDHVIIGAGSLDSGRYVSLAQRGQMGGGAR